MSGLTPDSRLVISADIVSQELEGELVLLDLERAEYYGLNPTGTRIFTLMTDGLPLGVIAERIAGEYRIDLDRASADVLTLADRLVAERLARISDAPPTP